MSSHIHILELTDGNKTEEQYKTWMMKNGKKAVDKTEEVMFGYCALRENRKARKASRKARYRSLKQQKGRVRALLHMVGEGIIFGIVYGIFWLIAGVMALRLKWLGERREKRYDSWKDN